MEVVIHVDRCHMGYDQYDSVDQLGHRAGHVARVAYELQASKAVQRPSLQLWRWRKSQFKDTGDKWSGPHPTRFKLSLGTADLKITRRHWTKDSLETLTDSMDQLDEWNPGTPKLLGSAEGEQMLVARKVWTICGFELQVASGH